MKIYESKPGRPEMLARCARDKVDPATLVEVVCPRGNYAIRCYARPTTQMVYDRDESGVVASRPQPAFIIYSLRRDGRICNGWGLPHLARNMLEIGAPFMESAAA